MNPGHLASGEPQEIVLQAAAGRLGATLVLPQNAHGLVIFAHGSGSSRHSPRNVSVAAYLNGLGLGTLLMDLLTPEEDRVDRVTAEYRFEVALLAGRLLQATDWAFQQFVELPIGLFGASTGAAAALVAAAEAGDGIRAVVSRGGRPDLAGAALSRVRAPTLLIVGGNDPTVIGLNRAAQKLLRCPNELKVIDGASHLFEEAGALESVSYLAGEWFEKYLALR